MNKTIQIEKIIAGGFGLARQDDGKVVLTRYVLPGEQVQVRETKAHRGHSEAELIEIITPSSDRTTPVCPVYTRCGGCDFQHISPAAQLEIKESIVTESLKRAGVAPAPSVLQPIVAAPDPYHYRYRIRLKLSKDGRIGFFKNKSNDLVEINECPVATEALNNTISELSGLRAPGLLQQIAPFIRELDIQHSPANDEIFILAYPGTGRKPDQSTLAQLGRALPHVSGIYLKTRNKIKKVSGNSDTEFLHQVFAPETAGRNFTLRWSPGCFSQVNAAQNSPLIDHVVYLAGDVKLKKILDLFCGMGNFSIPLGIRGAEVIGIEKNRASTEWAKDNAAKAGLANVKFIESDVLPELNRRVQRSKKADIIVLDPPRQGLGRSITQLAKLNPEKIIYISCDPATLARDLAFISKEGYTVTSLTPFDMFPQTHHIETVTLLEKN